jgi:hypothetical protein
MTTSLITSTTRLEKPLYLWLARIISLGVILASIGIGISWLPEVLDKLRHEGVTDVYWQLDQHGEAIIQSVSLTAEQNGVAVGDKLLNYEDDRGKLGTPVTFHIQRGNSPARDITFLRSNPANEAVYGGIQLGLSFDVSVTLAFLFILIPMMIGAVGSLFLYWLRSNDWMALLTVMLLAYFATGTSGDFQPTNPIIIIFTKLLSVLALFWFFIFPNGKLMPRWCWAVVLLVLPSHIWDISVALGLLTWNEHLAPILGIIQMLSLTAGLATIVILYFRYRYTFFPVERQQSKWVITGAIFGLLPGLILWLVYLFYSYSYQFEESAIAGFFIQSMNVVFTVSLTLRIFFSIFKYRLWDIDFIINRSLVYGALTVLLALVFGSSLFLVSRIVEGQHFIPAFGITAVIAGSSFNPARRRIQRFVDQRFTTSTLIIRRPLWKFRLTARRRFCVPLNSAFIRISN